MADSHVFINHYEVLGINIDATLEEISKAYRKKALICHPDKNIGDLKAVEKFQNILKSYLVLSDEKAKKALDAVLLSKMVQQKRNAKMGERRKKFLDDLLLRERDSFSTKSPESSYENIMKNYQNEINRLRRESSKLIEEQESFWKNMMKPTTANSEFLQFPTLKVTWKCSCKHCVIDKDVLIQIFEKYGPIKSIVFSSKNKKMAIVEFENTLSAKNASFLESGIANHPFTVTIMSDSDHLQSPTCTNSQSNISTNETLEDLEARIFSNIDNLKYKDSN